MKVLTLVTLAACAGCAATPKVSSIRTGDPADDTSSSAPFVARETLPPAAALRERALLVAEHHPTLAEGLAAIEREARGLGCDTVVRQNVAWTMTRLSIDAVCGVRTATLTEAPAEGVRVSLHTADSPGRLYVLRERTSPGPRYERPLCLGGCELTLAPGTYTFGRAAEDGRPLYLPPISVDADAAYTLRYVSHQTTRWVGLAMMAGSPLAGAAVGLPPIALGGESAVVPAAVASMATALTAIVVGYVLRHTPDEVVAIP